VRGAARPKRWRREGERSGNSAVDDDERATDVFFLFFLVSLGYAETGSIFSLSVSSSSFLLSLSPSLSLSALLSPVSFFSLSFLSQLKGTELLSEGFGKEFE